MIFLNPYAAGGTAIARWMTIAPALPPAYRGEFPRILSSRECLELHLIDALRHGEREFVAAGGDGTVNALVNCLMRLVPPDDRPSIRIGAVGLGSSNDFHKPIRSNTMVAGIPLCVDMKHARLRDIGCVDFSDRGVIRRKYFLINASIGITAQANNFFNNPDRTLHFLKRKHPNAAILYAAVSTLRRFRNLDVTISSPETGPFTTSLTNLGIIKNPWFSGSFRYEGLPSYHDGALRIFLGHHMNRLDVLRLMQALEQGRSSGIPKLSTWKTGAVSISSAEPFLVEFDGEISITCSASFSVLPQSVRVCTC